MVSSRPGATARGRDAEMGPREGVAAAGLSPLLGLPAGPQNSVNLGRSPSGVVAASVPGVVTFLAPVWAGRPKSHLEGGWWRELEGTAACRRRRAGFFILLLKFPKFVFFFYTHTLSQHEKLCIITSCGGRT